ncbi:MAG: hypothetical protein KGH64_05345 [Candidatus Micrarchaeota archaeon]|nr:hypothetical protein [Candidatus Micrarchaeota archaeon]MDE1834733.1 hypothetical protein [Candidatus Micrarchaeota archaeon]MDE1859385.1 hypothetical protein [Candidatus Micrarchaeota archaeon]
MGLGNKAKLQSSFELLITLSFGLAVLIPVIIIAFIQIANANTSLSAIEAQQAASKLSSVASLVGSEGFPARQLVAVNIPTGVINIFVGNTINGVGHQIIFEVVAPANISYITTYTPVNVSGDLSGVTSSGTYLINVSAQPQCPSNAALPCVYMKPVV